MPRTQFLLTLKIALVATFLLYLAAYPLHARLASLYEQQLSPAVFDRNGERIELRENVRGYYAENADRVAKNFRDILVGKEDRFFYYHPGVNPLSIVRSVFEAAFSKKFRGSSTLTQQLVKNLLGNENRRTAWNKTIETFYALALELFVSKDRILTMYANTAYFGGVQNEFAWVQGEADYTSETDKSRMWK